ncbi:hypothetical protein BN8_03322 [Fibrisoma limi BUZ 3]|uniref:3-keto-disaccharide hydrolase domain-containing protein n=1 Tax=Fibrisoma limi BUZ 3 TaxID=1185876 RepID=I2GJV2_9BACT|nr:hypothetical protein [Fibrisoma limi]CCH54177.1 hypothetical protein BN8_03322 [Fibrisoma limi BUZ 3]
MRLVLFITLLIVSTTSWAQETTVGSATSDWVFIRVKRATAAPPPVRVAPATTATTPPVARPRPDTATAPAVARRPTTTTPTRTVTAAPNALLFRESFESNNNLWLVGRRNGYEFEIAKGGYYIRKALPPSPKPAQCYIKLPQSVNLNKAASFTVTVDMVVPPGVKPDAGLLIGVKDAENNCQFRIVGTNQVSIKTVVNGTSFAQYMPGKLTDPKVPVDPVQNTLTVRKAGDKLHFYINGREVENSPHDFRLFNGNGIGFISASTTVKFLNLQVQLIPD